MAQKNEGTRNFTMLLRSDLDYEYLFAEISYQGRVIALINQEEGVEQLKLELNVCEEGEEPRIAWIVEMDEFIEALIVARNRLIER